MKKRLRNLTAGIGLGLASLLPMKNANAEKIKLDGWLETSLGNPTANLRLYPEVGAYGINLKSLIDINGYYSFTQTDLSHEKLKANVLGLGIKPVLTLFTDKYEKNIKPGLNISYAKGSFFGSTQIGANVSNLEDSTYLTYNGLMLPKNIGRVGVFATGKLKDMGSSYVELEATGPEISKGFSPYARINLQKGAKPGWQAGVSINPKRIFTSQKNKTRKKRK